MVTLNLVPLTIRISNHTDSKGGNSAMLDWSEVFDGSEHVHRYSVCLLPKKIPMSTSRTAVTNYHKLGGLK